VTIDKDHLVPIIFFWRSPIVIVMKWIGWHAHAVRPLKTAIAVIFSDPAIVFVMAIFTDIF
jgi:hypothetical protein